MSENEEVFSNDREVLFELACIKSGKSTRLRKFIRACKTVARICVTKYEMGGEQHEWMFMDTVPREDHRYFFDLVKAQCKYDKGEFTWKKTRTINVRGFCDIFRYLGEFGSLKNFEIPKVSENKENLKYIPETLGEHILLYLSLIDNIQMKYAVEKYDWSGIKNVVTLYDIGKPEHFVAIKGNEIGTKTVVLNHGTMFPFFDYRDLNTFNMYKVPSKYFLALGSDIFELAEKLYSNPEVIVCGQIKIEEQEYNPQEDVIAVVCDIERHFDENMTMINIAQKYAKKHGMHVYIRLHPGDDENAYKIDKSICKFEKDIDNAGVIIAYTTSMLFAYMAQGKRAMRYKGPLPFYSLPDEITFVDYDDFADKMKNIRSLNFRELVKKHIDCIGKESAEKYRRAFEYINGKS